MEDQLINDMEKILFLQVFQSKKEKPHK